MPKKNPAAPRQRVAPPRLGLQNRERQWKTSRRSPQVSKGGGYPNEDPRPEMKRKAHPVLSAPSAMSNETIQPKRGMAQLVQAQLVQENKCSNAFKLIQSRVLPVCEQSMMAFLPNIYMKRCESLREGQRANLEKKTHTFVRSKSLTRSEVAEVGKIVSQ